MIREAISTVVSGYSLAMEDAAAVMREIMEGDATPGQLGALLAALRIKGETAEEIAGFATVMREKALKVNVDGPLVDTVGTGGDGHNTFNISTATAFVAAGAGLKVAKHGNRAASSACGAADVLEALGVKFDLPPKGVERCIKEIGIGFMFAPVFHEATRHAMPVRRGDRHPDGVQHSWTADQPRWRPVSTGRRGLPGTGPNCGGGTAAFGLSSRHHRPRRWRLGRDHTLRRHLCVGDGGWPGPHLESGCGGYRAATALH